MNKKNTPDYVFETSWEVCNKVGGIYTVVSTKAKTMVEQYGDNFIAIGPDLLTKNTKENDFEEQPDLLKSWRLYAEQEGLRIRIGRWKIAGSPIVILINFTPYFSEKDRLFTDFWERYQLDSITGQWDYIEPFLFGYAAAKVIENYYQYFLSANDRIVAHFHEWMTGAGILYLQEYVPQVATVFTTHATVLGRSIAGNGLPLYQNLSEYEGEHTADSFQVRSKFSLEKLSALHADGFTTVSEITNQECKQFFGKEADTITPNGFENSFVPQGVEFETKQQNARRKILEIASATLGYEVNKNAILLINSGRYEYKNKGIDVFIESLGNLNQTSLNHQVIAVIAVPAGHRGVQEQLLKNLQNKDYVQTDNHYVTHILENSEYDPILRAVQVAGLQNRQEDNVKVVFIPSYLDGKDGAVDLSYFDFLIGFDYSIFPSYYEPWGYTPMESIAFGIPTITTSLAGFGLWMRSKIEEHQYSLTVVDRADGMYSEVVNKITEQIRQFIIRSPEQRRDAEKQAREMAETILWKHLIVYYQTVYDLALEKAKSRFGQYHTKKPASLTIGDLFAWGSHPEWKKVYVKQIVPQALQPLVEIAQNLWWSWNYDAIELFESINPERFTSLESNPIRLINSLSSDECKKCSENQSFMSRMNAVWERFHTYMQKKEMAKSNGMIAYFSMEFGIHDTLKIFSGGLGMLAGDYLKEASDTNKNMVGVGLLYRYGYFNQQINLNGEQQSQYYPQQFSHLPLVAVRNEEQKWIKVQIPLPGRTLYAKVWRCDVGRIPLYLLDTDIEENREDDRCITHHLYGGGLENRLKQEMLLGFGGVQAISLLGLAPDIYHSNEGHAAFLSLGKMMQLVENKKSYAQAKEMVRSSILYTTHTPVPAGHDSFPEEMVRMFLSHIPNAIGIDNWDEFMGLGKMHGEEHKFSMSALAMNFAQEVNGVSRIHGKVSREMFAGLYPGYFPEELHVDYVTNGVHFPTWVAKEFLDLYSKHFGTEFLSDLSNEKYWEKIYAVEDVEVWNAHKINKERLYNLIAHRVKNDLTVRAENPRLQFDILDRFDKNALTIGFARRFATYKRAHLLFSDLERLEHLVNNPQKPLQFVFAGKAHPNDKAGQDLITHIVEISKRPAFIGKILFLENYDMHLAKHLVRGVDVWLNTPTRPLEASGTSGEKATMNGVLNFSVLDGWWAEGWKEGAGWMLPESRSYSNQSFQDALDAQIIYETLEDEIIPAYYNKNTNNISSQWVGYMKNAIAQIAPNFTMKRQIDDYYAKFYSRLFDRTAEMFTNDGEVAREYAAWKIKMQQEWNNISLLDVQVPNSTFKPLDVGEVFKASVKLYLKNIHPEHVGVELLFVQKDISGNPVLKSVYPLEVFESIQGKTHYIAEIPTSVSGVYDFAFRIFAKHPLMPHRMDFPLVKWV